jgi:hypothetical protein
LAGFALGFAVSLPAQEADPSPAPAPAAAADGPLVALPAGDPSTPVNQRVLGVLPNYRTTDASLPFHSITARQKMSIAYKDSFDWPVIPTAMGFAGIYQLENQNPSFGQGVAGYAKRFATAYVDVVTGNFMTEGIMPSLFHQDPRYFRLGQGKTKSRLWYAATRIFLCKNDSGRWAFNYSEVVGNSAMAVVGNAYYPDNRTVSGNLSRLGVALATDSLAQVGKEFWPDIHRKLFHKKAD